MNYRKAMWQYIIVAVLMVVLALAMVGIIPPGAARAANIGSLSDNGTFAFVGIGAVPDAFRPLYVFGNVPLFERNQDSAGFIVQRTAANRWVFGVNEGQAGNGNGFVISTYPVGGGVSDTRFLITQQGRVGINTVSPDPGTRLNVYNDNQTYPNVAVYGETPGGYTYGVGGTNDVLQSRGWVGGSTSQYGNIYGIGAYGENRVSGKTGSLGGPTTGVYGYNGGSGDAGYFNGDVRVTGILYAPLKSFMIDHPLDPANKYLIHASVESPDMKNMYDGIISLDEKGEAVVQLPAYFQALNTDFRYQLTCIGGAALVYVADEIADNSFKIAGGTPGLKVSWQVTGIRHDTWAEANPVQVELEKTKAAVKSPALLPAGSGMQGWSDWTDNLPAMPQ